MLPQRMKIRDILSIDNSYTTLLGRVRGCKQRYAIVYKPPGEEKLVQLVSSAFAFHFHDLVSNFQIGFATGAIVGLVRERNPADGWQSDTIERGVQDKNSIYRGILRIIDEEDGIPIFMQSTKSIGNIAPALAYLHRGNPLEIQKVLNRFNTIQKSIVAKIQEGKPQQTCNDTQIGFGLVGDCLKADKRARAINRALEKLNIPEQY